jgi:hypothetical protein
MVKKKMLTAFKVLKFGCPKLAEILNFAEVAQSASIHKI